MIEISLEIDYEPFPYQEELHVDDRRFKTVVGGRRVGKSQVALQEAIVHCLTTPNALCWWVGPTYRDAKEVGFEMFMEYAEQLKPALTGIHHTNLYITFINGAKLYFKGSDKPDSLRGRGLTFVVLDEAAFCKEEVWTKVLRPALSDRKGRALFPSTPNGRNWYYFLHKRAAAPSTQSRWSWSAYHWPTALNPIIGPEEIEDAKNNLSDLDFRQEYMAEFITRAGMIYDDFKQDNIIDSFNEEVPPTQYTHTFFIGMDFGYANPTAACLMAIDNKTEKVYQIDELYVVRTPIEKISTQLQQMIGRHGLKMGDIRFIYSDPAGNADEISSGISPVDYLRGRGWRVDNKGSEVAPGLALVRSYILNASGKRRFFVHKRCKETIKSIYGYTYKLGIRGAPLEEPDKDGVHDHACDAVRYFFVNRFDHAKYFWSDLEQKPYSGDNSTKSRIMKRCGTCRLPFISRTPKHAPPFLCKECTDKEENK